MKPTTHEFLITLFRDHIEGYADDPDPYPTGHDADWQAAIRELEELAADLGIDVWAYWRKHRSAYEVRRLELLKETGHYPDHSACMSPPPLGPRTEEAIRKIREFAEDPAHWRRAGEGVLVPGDLEPFRIAIPVGYQAVYCIDLNGPIPFKHMSVSLHRADGQPKEVHPAVTMELAKLFGFSGEATMGTLESDPPWVVHALEPFEP